MIGIWLQVYLTLCFEIISAGWRVVVSGAVSCVFYTASYTTQMILWSIQINRRSAKSRFKPYLKAFSEQIVGLIWWFKFAGKKLKLEYTCVWKRQDRISRVTGSWKRLKLIPSSSQPPYRRYLHHPIYLNDCDVKGWTQIDQFWRTNIPRVCLALYMFTELIKLFQM